jgi:hypothetical protein
MRYRRELAAGIVPAGGRSVEKTNEEILRRGMRV